MEPRFEVQLDEARGKRIDEEGSSGSLPGQAGDAVHGPFDCVANPAPWWHQITVRSLAHSLLHGYHPSWYRRREPQYTMQVYCFTLVFTSTGKPLRCW